MIEVRNRQRSLEDKTKQDADEANITRQKELLKQRTARKAVGPAATRESTAVRRGKQPATTTSDEDAIIPAPNTSGFHSSSLGVGISANQRHPKATANSQLNIASRIGISPPTPDDTPPKRNAEVLPTPVRPAPPPPLAPSRQGTNEEPRSPDDENQGESSNIYASPEPALSLISPTAAAEAKLLFTNNPYRNGSYRAYLLNKQGAGSEFIAEMEGSIPQFELG